MRKPKLENKELKLNADLKGYKAGQIIPVKYKDGLPVDKYWRDRVKDSVIDNCVEVVSHRPKAVSSDKIAKKSQDEPQNKGKV